MVSQNIIPVPGWGCSNYSPPSPHCDNRKQMPRKRKIRFTHKKKRKKKRNYNMILLPVVPDILITVHDVITSVDGIQVPYPNVLTSPREGRCAGNFCSIPFSREKPHLEVKVMALSEVDVVTIGFGDICSRDTLRSIPGRCFGFGTR